MIITELAINKRTAIKMAAEYFFKHRKTTNLVIHAYNVKVELSYTGSRKDEQAIRDNLEIIRVFKKPV